MTTTAGLFGSGLALAVRCWNTGKRRQGRRIESPFCGKDLAMPAEASPDTAGPGGLETVRQIGDLMRRLRETRPAADRAVWAVWFDDKAEVFDRVADTPGTADPDEVRAMAAAAREQARGLRDGQTR